MRMIVLLLAFAGMFLGGFVAMRYQVHVGGTFLLSLLGLVGLVLWQELWILSRRLARLERAKGGADAES